MLRNILQKLFWVTAILLAVTTFGKNKNPQIRLTPLPIEQFSKSENRDVLWRYLLSNPHWDVREERGKRFAYLRLTADSLYNEDGYNRNEKKEIESKIQISFSGFRIEKNVSATRLQNNSNKQFVELEKSKLSPLPYQSWIQLGDSIFNITIFESSDVKSRTLTEKTLRDIRNELELVLAHSVEIQLNGYWNNFPCNDSLIVKSNKEGMFQIKGCYNFTSQGKVFIKIISDRGENLSGKMNRYNSVRPIGWNSKGEYQFFFSTYAINAEMPPHSTCNAKFEVWFLSTNGAETKISESNMMLITSFNRQDR